MTTPLTKETAVIGTKVQISPDSKFYHQGVDNFGNYKTGTITDIVFYDPYEVTVRWEERGLTLYYRYKDLVLVRNETKVAIV